MIVRSGSVPVRTDPATTDLTTTDLAITGMTCASCAHRIETRLNHIDGVEASVNYATEIAHVRYDPAQVAPADLVEAVSAVGYAAQPVLTPGVGAPERSGSSVATGIDAPDPLLELRQRVVICAVLTVPTLVLSMVPAAQFDNWQWLVLTLASPVVVWGAWPFHRAAWRNLRHGAATMDTLISIGTLSAYLFSLWSLFFGSAGAMGMTMETTLSADRSATGEHIYLEVAAAVTTFVTLGRYLEARAKRRAGSALRAVAELSVREATTLDGSGHERLVRIEDLAVGDRFVVRPGERVATDGIVESGSSEIDTSVVTGESVPREVSTGSEVIGATVNGSGRLVVRATKVGADTALAQIGRLVAEAQSGKAEIQRLADRVSGVFVPAVVLIAIGTLGVWLGRGSSVSSAFSAAVAVLIIACPCALGLATPTALLVGTGRAAQMGIVIRGVEVLESTRRIDTIVFDKTGTITTGLMQVVEVVAAPSTGPDEVIRRAGALESGSEHPIARAIVRAAAEAGPMVEPDQFVSVAGLGVSGSVEGVTVTVGRRALLEEHGLHVSSEMGAALADAASGGKTAVLVGWDGAVQGVVLIADTPRPTSAEAVTRFRGLGLTPILLTGDNEPTARAVARAVGIDEVVADVMPADKVAVIERLQREGRVVAMVGDGVNDAAALARADLGLAMGTGTDVAIEASDLTLVSSDLLAGVDAVALSRRTLAVIKGNLFWAFAYNLAAIPVAATGYLNPVIAGAAMAASSVFVVTNSLRLRRFGRSRTETG